MKKAKSKKVQDLKAKVKKAPRPVMKVLREIPGPLGPPIPFLSSPTPSPNPTSSTPSTPDSSTRSEIKGLADWTATPLVSLKTRGGVTFARAVSSYILVRSEIEALENTKGAYSRDLVFAMSLADTRTCGVHVAGKGDARVTLVTEAGRRSLDKDKLRVKLLEAKVPADVVARCFQEATLVGDPNQYVRVTLGSDEDTVRTS